MGRQRFRNLSIAAVAGVVMLATTACGGSDGGDATTDSPEPTDSSFPSVIALADALTESGLSCTLEYEGLRDDTRELSLCTVKGEQATLSIYADPSTVTAFLISPDQGGVGATAAGANWTVDVDSEALATQIADAVDGTVKP